MAAALGEGPHLGLLQGGLVELPAGALAMGEGHGAEGGDDQERARQLHGQDVVADDGAGDGSRIGVGVGLFQPGRLGFAGRQDRADADDHEA